MKKYQYVRVKRKKKLSDSTFGKYFVLTTLLIDTYNYMCANTKNMNIKDDISLTHISPFMYLRSCNSRRLFDGEFIIVTMPGYKMYSLIDGKEIPIYCDPDDTEYPLSKNGNMYRVDLMPLIRTLDPFNNTGERFIFKDSEGNQVGVFDAIRGKAKLNYYSEADDELQEMIVLLLDYDMNINHETCVDYYNKRKEYLESLPEEDRRKFNTTNGVIPIELLITYFACMAIDPSVSLNYISKRSPTTVRSMRDGRISESSQILIQIRNGYTVSDLSCDIDDKDKLKFTQLYDDSNIYRVRLGQLGYSLSHGKYKSKMFNKYPIAKDIDGNVVPLLEAVCPFGLLEYPTSKGNKKHMLIDFLPYRYCK